jgi:anti-anti-sigma regulatory factor
MCTAMLRITHAQTQTEQRWTLCGQLTGPWVAELRACWEHCRQVAGGVHTVVNLSDVTFIDESGEKLLWEMRSRGVKFVAAGIDTKHLLKHLKAKGERQLRRFIAPQTDYWETPDVTRNRRDK